MASNYRISVSTALTPTEYQALTRARRTRQQTTSNLLRDALEQALHIQLSRPKPWWPGRVASGQRVIDPSKPSAATAKRPVRWKRIKRGDENSGR